MFGNLSGSRGRGKAGTVWDTEKGREKDQGRCGAPSGVSFQPMHPTRDGLIGDRAFPEVNTVCVSAGDSRTISSEAAHNPDLASKFVFWSRPGSPGRLSRTAARPRRRPYWGYCMGPEVVAAANSPTRPSPHWLNQSVRPCAPAGARPSPHAASLGCQIPCGALHRYRPLVCNTVNPPARKPVWVTPPPPRSATGTRRGSPNSHKYFGGVAPFGWISDCAPRG